MFYVGVPCAQIISNVCFKHTSLHWLLTHIELTLFWLFCVVFLNCYNYFNLSLVIECGCFKLIFRGHKQIQDMSFKYCISCVKQVKDFTKFKTKAKRKSNIFGLKLAYFVSNQGNQCPRVGRKSVHAQNRSHSQVLKFPGVGAAFFLSDPR